MSRVAENAYGDTPAPYPNGPGHRGVPTSIDAAASIRPHLTKLQAKIMTFLRERGTYGATYIEVMTGCSLGAPTVCGRMHELIHAGLIKIADETRATPSGRQARVYIAAEFRR